MLHIGVWRHCSKSRPTSIGVGSVVEGSATKLEARDASALPSGALCAQGACRSMTYPVGASWGEDGHSGRGGIRKAGKETANLENGLLWYNQCLRSSHSPWRYQATARECVRGQADVRGTGMAKPPSPSPLTPIGTGGWFGSILQPLNQAIAGEREQEP